MPVKKIDVPTLFRLWNDHSRRPEDVARELGVSMSYLRRAASVYRLPPRPPWRNTSDNDAPSEAEELLSRDSLALSPWVAKRAEQFRRQKERDGEPQTVTVMETFAIGQAARRRRVRYA